MKRLILITTILLFLSSFVYAENSYKVITDTDTVDDISNVEVEVTTTTEKKMVQTLSDIDRQIAKQQERILKLQKTLEYYEELRLDIEAEAKKVKLKAKNQE